MYIHRSDQLCDVIILPECIWYVLLANQVEPCSFQTCMKLTIINK